MIIPPKSPMRVREEDRSIPHRGEGQIVRRRNQAPVPNHLAPPKRVSQEIASPKVKWKTFPLFSAKVVVSFFITLIALAGGVIYLNMTVPAVGILVNEKHFGYSASMGEAEALIYSATHMQGEETLEDANLQTDDKIRYMSQRVDKKTYEENQANTGDIAEYVTTHVPGYGISVDDQVGIVLENKDDAQAVLDELKTYYADASTTNTVSSVACVETIEVVETKALPLDIKTKDQAMKALVDGKTKSINYAAAEGESLWDVAQKHNVTIDAILAENKDKGLTAESTLTEGTELKLVSVQPYLNVVVEGMRVTNEEIAFETETKKDAKLVINTSKIEQEGEPGSKDVTYTYKSTNGVITEKTIIVEEVVKEPVAKVVVEGTGSVRLAGSSSGGTSMLSRGSGAVPSLQWPAQGVYTVSSGWRTAARPSHSGIDLANGTSGAAILCSADGVVVAIQQSNAGYGYMVLVDHGNGVGTRYAHLVAGSITVSNGQTVTRGQRLGTMGNTGNSRGVHLHYEVLVNGKDVNPQNYL